MAKLSPKKNETEKNMFVLRAAHVTCSGEKEKPEKKTNIVRNELSEKVSIEILAPDSVRFVVIGRFTSLFFTFHTFCHHFVMHIFGRGRF